MQKKGYLLLEKLMSCSSPSLEQFLQDHVSNIQQLLIETTPVVKSASKRVSVCCLSIAMTTCHHYLVKVEMYSPFCTSCDPAEYGLLV